VLRKGPRTLHSTGKIERHVPQHGDSNTSMIASDTKRPRNVDWKSAAAILYGDWGTSKAYVVGLAFAVAGYSSFWLIAAMCTLTALVGVNYMTICKHYPDGGGVYASVRHRSQIISIVGAFLLIADYIVTAALSALSAFQYLQRVVPIPASLLAWCAAAAIVVIGALNYLGPKHTGNLAFLISVPTAIVVVLLGLFCLPHAGEAVRHIEQLKGGFGENWKSFVGIVLALSGVEAIANATGVMPLNPGCDPDKPCVSKTSTKALVVVMIEVCIFTALLGFGMHALPGLTIVPDPNPLNTPDVNAPDAQGVRDYMLNYMAQTFVGGSWGHTAGAIGGAVVSIVFAVLLLSAVNTAIVDLIAISFLMARDKELPGFFSKLNSYGVPNAGLIVAAVIPSILVVVVSDMGGLADLYAVGVVGAIATNFGASSTDKKLDLVRWERVLMFCTFLIMVAIEISLFATKPNARLFALIVLAVGLILRGLASEYLQRKESAEAAAAAATAPPVPIPKFQHDLSTTTGAPLLCAIRGIGRTMKFAIEEARETNRPLYLLFVREQPVLAGRDHKRKWQEDPEAVQIFTEASELADGHTVLPCYAVSDSPADTIVDIAATVGASRVILGGAKRSGLISALRGNLIRQVSQMLPEEIPLLVYS
jgi:amino acid transporter/nucleotide-binding universal stress UspA family protein